MLATVEQSSTIGADRGRGRDRAERTSPPGSQPVPQSTSRPSPTPKPAPLPARESSPADRRVPEPSASGILTARTRPTSRSLIPESTGLLSSTLFDSAPASKSHQNTSKTSVKATHRTSPSKPTRYAPLPIWCIAKPITAAKTKIQTISSSIAPPSLAVTSPRCEPEAFPAPWWPS